MLTAILEGLLDLLAPRTCCGCDLLLDPDAGALGFCSACAPLLELVPAAHRPPAPSGQVYVHGGPLADAIRRMKYGDRSELAPVLGLHLAEAARAYGGLVDAVIPMPLHPRKLRARGYDQAALLARPVARSLGVPRVLGVLHRVRDTLPQAGLGAADRAVNVRGAFTVRSVCPARVLLVDDVRTTGATLAEAALALREGGARSVLTLCLSRADA